MNLDFTLPPIRRHPDVDPMDVVGLIRLAQSLSSRDGRSPVRFLSLGGDAPRERTGQLWNPSSLDGCTAKAVYKAAGARQDDGYEVGPDDQMVFDRGTVIGGWFAAYFRALEAYGVVQEVECTAVDRKERLAIDPALRLGGFVDLIFRYETSYFLWEVKSKDKDEALDKLTSPTAQHVGQKNCYQAMTGIPAGGVVYAGLVEKRTGRQALDFRAFPSAYSEQVWDDTRRRVVSLNRFIEAPERMPPKTSRRLFECPSCPYRRQCDAGLTPPQAAARAKKVTSHG